MHARVHGRDVVRAARFKEHGKSLVAERFHQRARAFLQERLSAGQFDQGQFRCRTTSRIEAQSIALPTERGSALPKPHGEFSDLGHDFFKSLFLPFRKSVRRVAVGTTKVASRQPDKHAGQAGERAFTLQAQVDFVDDQCRCHVAKSI